MDRAPLALGLAAVVPALAIMAFFLVGDVQLLLDPCRHWGADGPLAPSPECPSVSATSQTRASYLVTMLWVKGGVLLGCAASLAGFGLRRPLLAVLGAWLLFALSLPLLVGFGGVPVLLSSALVAAATRSLPPFQGAALWALRGLAVAALALFGTLAISAVASGMASFPFALLVLAIPLVMAWAAWWPRRTPGA